MALIVETGTGNPLAESYVSLEALITYLRLRNLELPQGMYNDEIEAALRRGTEAIDAMYGGKWIGARLTPDQALDWPRRGASVDGRVLATSPLPRYLTQAVCEASWREAGTPGVLAPDTDTSARVVSETVGPISVTYAGPSASEASGKASVAFTSIDRLLSRLTLAGQAASGAGGGSSYYLSRA